MFNLMKQEIKRNKISTYIWASIFTCFGLTAFIYFIAYVAQVENEVQFQNYNAIFCFVGVMSLLIFSILSATMYSRFVISEYVGAKLALLFSYPVNRKKILLSKILMILLFVTISMMFSTAIPFIIFSVTETINPIVNDVLSFNLFITTFQVTVISVLIVGCIGIISMWIGFINKSVPATLITSFILAGALGNVIVGASEHFMLCMVITGLISIVTFILTMELAYKINNMEVE